MTKKMVFTFGRFATPTVGHAKLVNRVVDYAKRAKSDHRIYASKSFDNNKNPIPYDQKLKYMKALFPHAKIHDDPKAHTAFHVAKNLSDEGYDDVTMVVGSDRVEEFKQAIGKYVKDRDHPDFDPKKHYGFKSFKVVSAGQRDDNAEGVEGMSASKLRSFAAKGDFDNFHKGIPTNNTQLSRDIYNTVRKNMKIQEGLESVLPADDINASFGDFLSFAGDQLGIKDIPKLKRVSPEGSFGGYNPATKEISIATKNRHPMDVYRTIAHELVHHKQNMEGRIKDVAKEGSTGSDIENEANAHAGIIMRNFAKTNPKNFKLKAMTESVINEGVYENGSFKAIFLAGGPGSGKDYILKQCIEGNGLIEINTDKVFELLLTKENLDKKMPDSELDKREPLRDKAKISTNTKNRLAIEQRKGIIINGTASDIEKIASIKYDLEKLGYETMMIFVSTKDEVSKQRNIDRGNSGGRTVPETVRKQNWAEAMHAKHTYSQLFGDNKFVDIDNSVDLRNSSVDEIISKKNEFNQVYKKVKSFTAKAPKSMRANDWINSEIFKKGQTKPSDAKSTKFGSDTTKPKTLEQSIIDKARSMGLEYYKFGRFGKNGKVTHIERNGQLILFKVAEETNKKFETLLNEKEGYPPGGAGEWGTPELTNNYKNMTPGESNRVYAWASSKSTQDKYYKKYGSEAEKKLKEACERIINAFGTSNEPIKKKSIREFREYSEVGIIPIQRKSTDYPEEIGEDKPPKKKLIRKKYK